MGGRGGAGFGSRSQYPAFSGTDQDYKNIEAAINNTNYQVFGIRVHEEDRKVGDHFNLSEDTSFTSVTYGKKLDGTSSIGININRFSSAEEIKAEVQQYMKQYSGKYQGKHISIVGGRYGDYGDDPGELVISDPTIGRRRGARLLYKIK